MKHKWNDRNLCACGAARKFVDGKELIRSENGINYFELGDRAQCLGPRNSKHVVLRVTAMTVNNEKKELLSVVLRGTEEECSQFVKDREGCQFTSTLQVRAV